MKRRASAAVMAALVAAASARADGGRLRVRLEDGPFAVAVFTSPEPLAVGPADVSVLVQEPGSGAVILDADVVLEISGPGPALRISAGAGTNRLLQSALVDLPTPGVWRLGVTVRRGAAVSRVSCDLPVSAPASRLSAVWPFLAIPPVAVALFALRGALAPRRRRR